MTFHSHDPPFPRSRGEARLPGVGELVLGKYRVEACLGVGGMGAVFAARHEQLGQVVALKVLNPAASEDPDAVLRFMREAEAVGSLESDHVVRVFDVGTLEDGAPCMVMERLVGRDLGDVLSMRGPLDVSLAIECAYQAVVGVTDAHEAGIIHRDLKPSNLFLMRRRDGSPWVKVLDFGISKAQNQSAESVRLTQTRTIVGSPLYMSPEQVRDARSVDARSDLWSVGIILQELLTGRPAFEGDTLPSVCARIVADPPEPIVRPDVPPELLEVVARCLQKVPARRYQTAQALGDALRALRAPVTTDLAELGVSSSGRSSLSSHAFVATQIGGAAEDGSLVSDVRPRRPAASAQASPWSGSTTRVSGNDAETTAGGVDGAGVSSSGTRPALPLSQTVREEAGRPGALRRAGLPLLGVAVVAAALALFVRGLGQEPPSSEVATSVTPPSEPSPPASFVLRVVSTPPGALVVDGDTVLGTTPLAVPMLAEGSRTLEVRLVGYRSHRLHQEPLERDTEVRLELVPEEPPAQPSPVSPPESAPAAPPRATGAKNPSRAPQKPAQTPRPVPSDDIRTQR